MFKGLKAVFLFILDINNIMKHFSDFIHFSIPLFPLKSEVQLRQIK